MSFLVFYLTLTTLRYLKIEMANKEKNKALEKQKKMDEDQFYEEKLARERQILNERYEQEKQRDIKLRATAF
jgi:hypothetical protein